MALSGLPTLTQVQATRCAPLKGEPRKRVKARRQRQAQKVVKRVRAHCVERDGGCRLGEWERNPDDWHAEDLEGDCCDDSSEWAHFADQKRYRTRGMVADVRHTTAGSLMLCRTHHRAYDARTLNITAMTNTGCDGPLRFTDAEQSGRGAQQL